MHKITLDNEKIKAYISCPAPQIAICCWESGEYTIEAKMPGKLVQLHADAWTTYGELWDKIHKAVKEVQRMYNNEIDTRIIQARFENLAGGR